MSNVSKFSAGFATNVNERLRGAFGFVLNLAWAMLLKDIFSHIVGKDPGMKKMFFVVLLLTAFSVAFSVTMPENMAAYVA